MQPDPRPSGRIGSALADGLHSACTSRALHEGKRVHSACTTGALASTSARSAEPPIGGVHCSVHRRHSEGVS